MAKKKPDGSLIIILFLIIGGVLFLNQTTSGAFLTQFSDLTGETLLTVRIHGLPPGEQSILASPVTAEPGQTVSVAVGTSLLCDKGEPDRMEWQLVKDGGIAQSHVFTDEVRGLPCGTSIAIEFEFTAPDEPGDYLMRYFIRSSETGANLLSSEGGVTLKVGTDTECPEAETTAWRSIYPADPTGDGIVQQKDTITYQGNNCQATPSSEFRTLCNAGYHIKDTNLQFDHGVHECVEDSSQQQQTQDGGSESEPLIPTTLIFVGAAAGALILYLKTKK